MLMNDYQEAAREFAVYPPSHAVSYPVLGCASEAGELCGKLARVIRDGGNRLTEVAKIEMVLELGDILWHVSQTAEDLGVTLQSVAEVNLAKLGLRQQTNTIHGEGDHRESDVELDPEAARDDPC